MAKKCHYPKNAKTVEELASIFDDFLKGSWSPLIEGGITADNLSQYLFSPSLSGSPGGGSPGGARLAPVPGSNGPSRVLAIPLLHRDEPGTIRQKMSGNKAVGVEMLVDSASGEDGRFCLVDWKDTAKRQVVSLAIDGDDGEVVANEGDLNVNADGEVNIQGIGSKKYLPRTVKFANGTILRTLDTSSYTLNNLADILYTLAYDNRLTGTISGWTATASATYTFDLTSFTANTLAAFLATVINDIQANGYLSVSLYRVTTPRARFALDCDSFTLNQLGQATCAFMSELGVSGLEAAVAGTVNKIPRFVGANTLGDSAADDDGTRIKLGRSSMYLGGDDLAIERSAAGKAILKDPSGGVTTPMLQLGGATSASAAIKADGTQVQLRLADDSTWAPQKTGTIYLGDDTLSINNGNDSQFQLGSSKRIDFSSTSAFSGSKDSGIRRQAAGVTATSDGSTGFGDHALKHLLGYGAATGFRTKIDFGTPTADRTLTAPNRDLTLVGRAAAGTNNKIIRFDANGDAKDAGLSDDGTTLESDRDTFVGGGTFTLRARDQAASGRSMTVRAGDGAGLNGGSLTLRAGTGPSTKGALDLQHADGASRIKVNADGTVTQAGDHTFSGTLTATADVTLGNLSLLSTTQTASNGGNYAVAATIATVFVAAAALGTTNNYDVTLPSAATYGDRVITVKITTVGGGSSTVTVKSSSGTVEGAAAATGVPMDATARSKVTYQSDGTNWWSV